MAPSVGPLSPPWACLPPVVAGQRARRTNRASITLYNGQHPETTDSLVAAFEKATGIKSMSGRVTRTSWRARSSRKARVPPPTSSTRRTLKRSSSCNKGLLAAVHWATLAKLLPVQLAGR